MTTVRDYKYNNNNTNKTQNCGELLNKLDQTEQLVA